MRSLQQDDSFWMWRPVRHLDSRTGVIVGSRRDHGVHEMRIAVEGAPEIVLRLDRFDANANEKGWDRWCRPEEGGPGWITLGDHARRSPLEVERFAPGEVGEWTVLAGYCATRCLAGADPYRIEHRVAFIEKTPRVRVAPYTTREHDWRNWLEGPKGAGGGDEERAEAEGRYGFSPKSRAWCDEQLAALGYVLADDREHEQHAAPARMR